MTVNGGEHTPGNTLGGVSSGDGSGISAMTGRNSPWGGGGGNDGGDQPGESANGDSSADTNGGDQPSTPEQAPDKPDDKRGPRNPWLPSGNDGTPPRRSAGIEDIFRRGDPRRPGGGGGGPRGPGGGFPNLPRRPDGSSWLPLGIGVAVVALLAMSSFHMLGPKEQGVVTTLGKYSRTIDSGVSLTAPWPIEQVQVVDVSSFQVVTVPDNENEKLMLTSDKSLVDLSYLVRWNIKGLKDYTFRLADPDETVQEVAEAAMRASIAQVTLSEALSGAGRAQVEQDVSERMQRILDFYRSGIAIQGVEIKKADPPAKTKGAFDNVNVAQQEAERDRSQARAAAQQVIARAQGEATAFDKVYEEYKLAPEVTKRRMYYETMERVLADNDTVVGEKGANTVLPLPPMERRRAQASPGDISVNAAPAVPQQGGQ